MKNILITIIVLMITLIVKAQKISEKIGTNPMSITSSAVLEVESTTKGFLPPRMTYLQMNAISSPPTGLIVWCIDCSTYGGLMEYKGSSWTNLNGIAIENWNEVTSTTNRVWMDRNLGAFTVAKSSNDELSFGDLYQWGRERDGHEKRDSSTTTTQSSTNKPSHSNFIMNSTNWLITPNNSLWQGVNGVNNPCPAGFRIPTSAEWYAEVQKWSSSNISGAFASSLSLPKAGYRDGASGNIYNNAGFYWSSSIDSSFEKFLFFDSGIAAAYPSFSGQVYFGSYGGSVRCIKHE
jgi:uncharacterized protein (TIGR02145 family)